MRQPRVAVLLTFAVGLVGAAPAAAAPTWLPAAKSFGVTPATSASSGAVTAPDGTVALGKISVSGTVQVRTRSPGGALSSVTDLDVSGTFLHLIAGPDGSFAVLWARGGSTWAAVRPPGGDFGAPRSIAPEAVQLANGQAGLDGQGRLWIVYEQGTGARPLTAATLPPATGSGALFPLDTPPTSHQVDSPSLAVEPGGTVHVVWVHTDRTDYHPNPCTIRSEARAADGTSSGFADASVLLRRTLSAPLYMGDCSDTEATGAQILSAQSAVSATGDLTAVFRVDLNSGSYHTVVARHRAPGAAWSATDSPPETVASTGREPSITYAGTTPVAAIQPDINQVAITARGPDGSWPTPTPVSGADGGTTPVIAGSPSGTTALAFREWQGAFRTQALVRGPDGSLSSLTNLSGAAQDNALDSISMDEQGNAVVGWTRKGDDTSSAYQAEYAGYDGAGPRLDGLSVPSPGVIGQPLAFSVAPVDVWSSVAGVSWAFGDGVASDGASVSHAYSAAGDFAASVSATDTLGNASSATRTVSVPAVAPPPGDTTKPKFKGKVKVSPGKVKRGKKAKLTFNVSEPAKLKATLARKAKGVKKGKRCVAPPRKHKRGQKRCTRNIATGSFAGTATKSGAGKLTLPARFKGKKLARGKYTVTLVATDAAGNRSKPVSASFTVK